MKELLTVLLLGLSISVRAQKPVPVPGKLISTADSIQYMIGAYVGLWLNSNGLQIGNKAAFQRGLDDILQKRKSLIPDSLIAGRIEAYQESMLRNKASEQEKNLFASLNGKQGLGMLPNGVRYLVLLAGKNPRPSETDTIVLNMIAKLPDQTEVENTYQSKTPFVATPTSFFPALNEALQMMPKGAKWELYFPAALAYGEKGTARIPPNSALVVEIELIDIRPARK